jgi:uncharacterized protein (TIGR03032 family)
LNSSEISLLVTTYPAGKLVALWADDGVLNTHFRSSSKPMGLALRGPQLAIGTQHEVWEYHANDALAPKMGPLGKCDRCFMPRVGHVTGDMQIHEMEWVDDELWFVNTLFSCLAVRSIQYSVRPQWQPPFVTSLAPEDRCHLNGLGLRDGQIRYLTALGQSDAAAGWRERKKDGGIVMDTTTNKIQVDGLAMPHSPRWYNDRLRVLESGTGTIGTVDVAAKNYRPLKEVSGFTRELDFCGSVAFVGLSQVRESAAFSGIPITERSQERTCGLWAIHIQTGEILGWVKFEDSVQEIFAVRVVPGIRFPDLVNHDMKLLDGSFVLPDADLLRVPHVYRSGI